MKKVMVLLMVLIIGAVMTACVNDSNDIASPSNVIASPSATAPITSPSSGATNATDGASVTETASATNNGL